MRKAVFSAISVDDMTAMLKKLVELAREGNVGAIKLVLAYAIGKPSPAADPDEFDMDSDKGYTKLMEMLGNDGEPMNPVDAELILEAVRTVRPEISKLLGNVTVERIVQKSGEGEGEGEKGTPEEDVPDKYDLEFEALLTEEAPSTNGEIGARKVKAGRCTQARQKEQ